MLLILEIFLTVRAWKVGWTFLALLPVALALATGVAVGLLAPEMLRTTPLAAAAVDLVAVVVLGVMSLNPRKLPSDRPAELTTAA